MTNLTPERAEKLTQLADWVSDFTRIAEIVLGYPARMMTPPEWREAFWRIWPPESVFEASWTLQDLHDVSEWLARSVPLVEKRVGKHAAEMSAADWEAGIRLITR